MATPKDPTAKVDELAAPLDLLLTSATKPFASRMMPNATWARFAANLAQHPGAVADRVGTLTRELGNIAVGKSHRAPARADKRFSDPAWQENPLLHRIMQAYLAGSETAEGLLADAQLDWRDKEKMQFVIDNFVEGLAPSNNPLISPLGWKALIDTGGLSAVRGVRAFARDMLSKPRVPAMIEPDAYAVGENVAVTKGAVVLQTSVFELIQYVPQTPKVRTIPLLMVPPVINKYYVMDIAPGRSMIEYFVQQGQQVFVISWRNPQARHRDWGFDTYGAAIVEAMDAVQKIAGTDSTHLLATCSGGILAAMTAAHLAEIGEGDRVAGLNLAVTVLDETRAGFAAAAMSDRAAQAAIRVSGRKGFLDGRDMAEMFAWLRPTDLVWRYCGEQLRAGPEAGAVRRVVLERRHHPDDRRAAPRPGADGAAERAGHPRWGQHAGQPGRPVQDHIRRLRRRRRRRPHLPVAGHLSQRAAAGQQGQPVRACPPAVTSRRWSTRPATRRRRSAPVRSTPKIPNSGWTPLRSSLTPGGRTTCPGSPSAAARRSTLRKPLAARASRRWVPLRAAT